MVSLASHGGEVPSADWIHMFHKAEAANGLNRGLLLDIPSME